MAVSMIEITQIDQGSTSVDQTRLAELERSLDGRILFPDDPGWEDATETWNGMVAQTPALVVQPASTSDVTAAVDFAREKDLLLSVRGAGHNIAGTSIAPAASPSTCRRCDRSPWNPMRG